MRESIRLQKPEFYKILQEKNTTVVLLLSYHAKNIANFNTIDDAIKSLLKKIINGLQSPV